jgi:hypothetical protein
VVALLAAAALIWMVALPYVLSASLRKRTGFDVEVQSLMVNPLSGEIRAQGVVVNNPPTFPQPEFLQVREFSVDAEVLSLFSDRPVLNEVKIDIGLVALVKRSDGRSNAEVFRGYLAEESETIPVPGQKPPPRGKEFLIRNLVVRFDRLLVMDNTGKQPVLHEYPLKIDRTYQNVTDGDQLLLPASLDQIFALGGAVGSLLPDDVGRILDEALRSGSDLLKKSTSAGENFFKGFSDTLEESKKP